MVGIMQPFAEIQKNVALSIALYQRGFALDTVLAQAQARVWLVDTGVSVQTGAASAANAGSVNGRQSSHRTRLVSRMVVSVKSTVWKY